MRGSFFAVVLVLGCVSVHTSPIVDVSPRSVAADHTETTWYYDPAARRSLQETRVLRELYYLAKVVRAFRALGSFASPLFKRIIERITNEELMGRLERTLVGADGFEVIRRIGMEGMAVDRMQIALANDYRLLAPVVLRTLRRLSALRTIAADDGVLIGQLEEELLAHVQPMADNEEDRVEEDRIHFEDFDSEWPLEEDVGRSVGTSDPISELIRSELDKFLAIVEQLSGISGIAGEFDRADRKRMADDVRRRYDPLVGLDQRFFVGAVKQLLTGKVLYEGRFELLEALDYVKSQLDGLEESEPAGDYENFELDYPTT